MGRLDRSCPIEGCTVSIPRSMAMCRHHWHKVPEPLQKAVWREYRRAPGSAAHLQALEDAQAAVEGREPEELFA